MAGRQRLSPFETLRLAQLGILDRQGPQKGVAARCLAATELLQRRVIVLPAVAADVRTAEPLAGSLLPDAKAVPQGPVVQTSTQAAQLHVQNLRSKRFGELSAELAVQAIEVRPDMTAGRNAFFVLAAQPEGRAVIVRLGHACRT